MEIKKHFKMYKNGKQWCCMALASVAAVAGLALTTGVAQADDVAGDSSNQPVVAKATSLSQQEAAAQKLDDGNYGCLDSAQVVNSGDLAVSGWQATNQAADKPYRYVVAVDSTTNQELGRTQVTQNVTRPDVQKVYPNVVNANQSGYQATMQKLDWTKVKNVDDHLQIVSRYSSEANGEGHTADVWNQNLSLDKGNYASLDNFSVQNNQLHVAGWNATNKALGKSNHYLILFDQTAGHEIARQKVTAVSRPDVAKVYPQVIGADQAGFTANFSLAGIDLTHNLQLISRYSDAANGEGSYVNYWFTSRKLTPANTSNQANLDSFNLSNGDLVVSGWHATDYSQIEGNHYLILFDQTANRQVASIKVSNVARPDVAKAYPSVKTAGQSGFQAKFDQVNLTPGHAYTIVSRYSTLSTGNGDNGQSKYTDYWFNPVKLNQQAFSIDSFTSTKEGLQVSGWVASDQHITRPYAYLILLQDGKEVTRSKLNLTARPDVAKVYPSMYQSANSGFTTTLKVDPASLTGNLQLLLRFTDDQAGNGKNTNDQLTQTYPTNTGNFDEIHVTAKTITISGWHADTRSANKPYQYIIALDSNNQEVGRWEITDKGLNRSDVQKVYPYLANSGQSGFKLTFNIPDKMQGHLIHFIHCYTDDEAGNGNRVDFVSKPVLVNLQYNMNANAINRYILNNHIGHANITVNHVIPDVTGEYSGTSDGKPNMVVVHETANPNDSIQGEINYEKANYNSAFVHAFVDSNQIIEISPTDNEAWGASYPANGRAVQFEQVEVYGANNFARELANAAYYAAYKMNEYGMAPSLAQADGTGTLWSHHDVTRYIANGKTDHTDPDGYWANRARYFGTSYTMSDFFELVKYEYSQL